MKQRARTKHVDASPGRVRIIGGRWRGTRLDVVDVAGLRPSSDRVRETLFNWLAPVLPGARVLDLFAGSGALGIEAVSRGAAGAVLVERDARAAAALRATAARLQGGEVLEVIQADALAWLGSQASGAYDVAFVDPPFAAGAWEQALAALQPRLAADARVYVEAPGDWTWAPPSGWALHRQGRTRELQFALYRLRAAPGEGAAGLEGAGTLASNPSPDGPVSE